MGLGSLDSDAWPHVAEGGGLAKGFPIPLPARVVATGAPWLQDNEGDEDLLLLLRLALVSVLPHVFPALGSEELEAVDVEVVVVVAPPGAAAEPPSAVSASLSCASSGTSCKKILVSWFIQ